MRDIDVREAVQSYEAKIRKAITALGHAARSDR